MLKEKELKQIKEELETAKRPLFIFDDDPDGLCSFLLCYRFLREGKGVLKKSSPKVTTAFLRRVEEYNPDKVFILDVPIVEQDFLDAVKVPVIWIDHHEPLDRHGVRYFNPRVHDSGIYYPVTKICYDVLKQDLWLAMVGCVADWHIPDFKNEFCEKYPGLMDCKMDNPGQIAYETKLGKLIRMFSFCLKGKSSQVMKRIKVLTRIEKPEELLERTTAQGRFILKHVDRIEKEYQQMLKEARKKAGKGKVVLYKYRERQWAMSRDLAGEMIHLYPEKIIMVCREKSGEFKCSIRSRDVNLKPIVEKSLQGVEGYGGGHEYACGAVIKVEDFEQFIKNFKGELR